jgi:hypothetical protein
MEFPKSRSSTNLSVTKKLKVLERELEKLTDEKRVKQKKDKGWTYPTKWGRAMKHANKPASVLVWYLNIKGELEKPKLYPLRSGGRVVVKGRPYDANPQAFISIEGKQKCLLVREIDRRPFCNVDWKEVKERGDLTDSDDILLKTAMDARIMPKPPIGKAALVIAGIVVVGALMYFFTGA